jgi:hypothetical protein
METASTPMLKKRSLLHGVCHTSEWEKAKRLPIEVFQKAHRAGLLPGVVRAPSVS